MTIELSPPSTANKPATSHAGGSAKNKNGASSEAPESGSGFTEILSSLDDSTDEAVASGTGTDLTQDTASPVGKTAMPAGSAPDDAFKLLTQSQMAAQRPAEATVQSTAANAGARRPAAQASVGEKPEATTQIGNAIQATSVEAARKAKASSEGQALGGPISTNTQTADATAQQGNTREFKETLIQNLIQAVMRDKEMQPLAGLTPAREKLAEERSIFKSQVTDPQPVAQNIATSGSVETSISTVEGAVGVDNFVAEQVTYWISQDVQNAEMKLDGLGVEPVDVSIRLQGNEATVSFTTDEVQARSALEGAGAHLKDMLERQGMVLTGMSVGGHGADGAPQQDRDRKPRQGAQTGTVQASKLPQLASVGARGGVQGRSLDLYV